MKNLEKFVFEQELAANGNIVTEGWLKKFWNWFWGSDDKNNKDNKSSSSYNYSPWDYSDYPYNNDDNDDNDDDPAPGEKKKRPTALIVDKEKKEYRLTSSNDLIFAEITSSVMLNNYIDGSDKKADEGFWLFNELLQQDSAYEKINISPFYIKYEVVIDNSKQQRFGMLAYSVNNNANDSIDSEYKNYMHIFGIQTNPIYSKNGYTNKMGLLKIYINHLTKIAKTKKMDGLTLMCDNKNLVEVYRKQGFELVENNFMVKKFE